MVEKELEEKLKAEIAARFDSFEPQKTSFCYMDEWVLILRADPSERGVSTSEFISLINPMREICIAHGVEFRPEHATFTSGPERWGFYYM